MSSESSQLQKATFAGGCFWCTEAVFKRLKGVVSVMSGYSGGTIDNPDYEMVSMGRTGHAEAIQITFDPKIVSYEKLLHIFFATHDPTTLNRQGADVGTQYRSSIFCHDANQKEEAEKVKREIEKEGKYNSDIVTEIVPFEKFYKAEEYHQDYYKNNPQNPYCSIVIDPKVQKLLREFNDSVKEEYKIG